MFEDSLKALFEGIFGIKKVTFDSPLQKDGEPKEQDCLFIQIEDARNSFKDGQQISKVSGNAYVVSSTEKMPFGFFSKAIDAADSRLTKDLFFFDIETNNQRYRDIVQRGFSFVYFFNSQYDPDIGTITSVDLSFEET